MARAIMAAARGSYLTGIQVKKTTVDIQAGVSCDQIVAKHLADKTRFPSLEVGLEDARQAGDCDSGYSCAYTNNLAWKSETQPLPPILDPRALFERLFGNGADAQPRRRARGRRTIAAAFSILSAKIPGSWKRRSVPRTAASSTSISPPSARWSGRSSAPRRTNAQIDPHMEKPYGVPADFAEHFKLMTNMITIAFQADLTRVVTFLMTREGTSRPYREIGISDGHHPCTHHRNKPDLIEKVTQINTYHAHAVGGLGGEVEVDPGKATAACSITACWFTAPAFPTATAPARGFADADRSAMPAAQSRPAGAWCIARKRRCAICTWR